MTTGKSASMESTVTSQETQAQVIARLSIFKDAQTKLTVPGGTLVSEVWKQLKVPADIAPNTWINGSPVDGDTVIGVGDVVNVVVAPRNYGNMIGSSVAATGLLMRGAAPSAGNISNGGTASASYLTSAPKQTPWQQASPWLGGALGLGAQLLLSFWGRSRAGDTSKDAQTEIAQQSEDITPNSSAAFDSFGGPADTLLPQLAGVSNRSNPYGRMLQVLGDVVFFPPKSTNETSYLSGQQEVLTAAFDCGYGRVDLSEFKVGTTTMPAEIQKEVHEGVADQADFTLIRYVGGEKRLNHELTPQFVPAWDKTDGEAEVIGFDVYFPNGLYQIERTTVNGVINELRVAASVSIGLFAGLVDQAYSDLGNEVITDNYPTSFRKTIYRNVTKGKQQVFIRRNTAEDTTGLVIDKVVFTKLQWHTLANPFGIVKDSKGDRVWRAEFAIAATATDKLQGQLEQISVRGKSYAPAWNGSSYDAPAITNNNAWLALLVLRGQANYDPPDDDEIDADSFKEWAEFCVLMGITYNKVIDSETQPQAVLNEIFALGRAKQVERDGKISVIIDRAQTQVVQHFSLRNSWGFHWKAVRGPTPDMLKVQFVNPDADWQMDERIVYFDGKHSGNYKSMQTLQLPGCTSATLAYKHGRFVLKQDYARRRYYQWYSNLEAVVCTRGDLVRVTHPLIGAGTGTGIVKQLVTNGSGDIIAIKIDSKVQMLPDKTYQIRIRQEDGSSYSGLVVTAEGNSNHLTLATPIPAATAVKPTRGDLLLFGESPDESREMIVTNIEWSEGLVALITAVDHAPSIYGVDSEPVDPFVSNIQRRHPLKPFVAVPVINGIESDEHVLEKDSDGSYKTRIVLEMEAASSLIQYFEVQFKAVDGFTWTTCPPYPASGGTIKIEGVEDGVYYDIKVRSRRYDFWTSDWNESIKNYFCIGKTTPPPDLPPLEIDNETGNIRVFTDTDHGFEMPRDFAGVRAWMHYGQNYDVNSAVRITQLTTGNIIDISKYARGLKTILVKAVDTAGNESVNAAAIVKDFGENIVDNILEQFDYHPLFPGIHNGVIDDDVLKAGAAGKFWSGNPAKKFWKGQPSAKFWVTQYDELVYEFTYKPDRNLILLPFTVKLATEIDALAYKIEYSRPGRAYFWDRAPDGGTKKFWSGTPSGKFWSSQDNWLPMPETGLPGSYGKYKFRITCYASRYRPIIQAVSVIVDVPDIIKRYSSLVISNSAAGVAVPIPAGTFRSVEYINPALILDPSYPNARTPEADRSVDPPVIRMRDAAGSYTTGKVDVEVGGY